jgi:hypothetical protein
MKDMNEILKHGGWPEVWMHKAINDLVIDARLCHATPGDLRRLATGLELMAKHLRVNADDLARGGSGWLGQPLETRGDRDREEMGHGTDGAPGGHSERLAPDEDAKGDHARE